jgi:glycine cleavage system pyridoxal-binding protein P
VEIIKTKSNELIEQYPEAIKHVRGRSQQLSRAFDKLHEDTASEITEIETKSVVLDLLIEYRDWMLWITEMVSSITSYDLATSYNECVYLIEKHNNIHDKIFLRKTMFYVFLEKFKTVPTSRNFKSSEMETSFDNLIRRKQVRIVIIQC